MSSIVYKLTTIMSNHATPLNKIRHLNVKLFILVLPSLLLFFPIGNQPAHAERPMHTQLTQDQEQSIQQYLKSAMKDISSGKPEDALLQVGKALKLDPNSAEAFFLRGRAKHDIGLKREALDDYSEALRINPRFPRALVNRALVKAGLGELKSAIRDLNLAISIDPLMASAYSNRAVTFGALGNRKAAIDDFTKAIKLDPKYADAYRNRGISLELTGDIQGACADWRKAAALGQLDVRTWVLQQCGPK